MVFGALPSTNLGPNIVKQFFIKGSQCISKTVSKSPFIVQKMCIPVAELYNQVEVKWRLRSAKLSNKGKIPPLYNIPASRLGTHLLSKIILFTIFATFFTCALLSHVKNECKKKRLAEENEKALLNRVTALEHRLDEAVNQDKKQTPCRSKLF